MSVLTINQRARINRRGGAFTLIELLLVMVIITILATILVPRVVGHLEKAKITKAQADLSTLKQSLNTFYIDNGRFPTTGEGLQALIANPGNLPKWEKSLDKDTLPMDPWDHPYIYRCPSNTPGDDFDVLSSGPDGQEGTADDIKPE
jgi:general secretion pathway protein G